MNITVQAMAQSEESGESAYPPFKMLRAAENYAFLKEKEVKSFWDRFKYIPLGKGDGYLSLGGDVRSEFQSLRNQEWEEGNDDRAILFQRFMLHSDWKFSPTFRLFTQLKSGLPFGRDEEPSPLDKDPLDLHQLFLEVSVGNSTVQLGRQELWYGSRRLISIREGTNVRQSFDGIRWIWEKDEHQIDFLAFTYNPQQTGVFDNEIDDQQLLWGIYHVWNLSKTNFDFYYLGVHNETTSFEEGNSSETRHSFGVRHWGTLGKLTYNNETLFQFGDFGDKSILAWTASTELHCLLSESPSKPTIGLKTEIISGDRNQGDDQLQTFNPLYPRGGYFGLLALIGPANLIDAHPSYKMKFGERWSINTDWDFFWRYSLNDGIYFPSGRLNVGSNESRKRFIGHQIGGEIVFEANRFLELEASYFYFFTGSFLKDVTEGADLQQIGASMKFRF